ncbi:CMRF35-like molecule 5 [Talpa occidentalis]|uniref:CMRF35-like molecule 5 n=1 Tax=Talpa occidentalis TaxID=50954 RepID=UPI00188FE932|nr:CMRF35-like molecule 5 [Talpa occidentalis]
MDMCFPGSSAVTGPGAVKGWERGSLTVQCRYDPGYETHKKWWCRGAPWGSCNILVRTTGSEQEVKKGCVSIRDHQKNRTITVTMEALTLGDADTYWCGVEREGHDLGAQVKVTVDPAATTVSTTTTSSSTAPVTPDEDEGSPTIPDSGSLLGSVHFLLLVFLKVPLLLGMLSAVLWVHRPQAGHRDTEPYSGRDGLSRHMNSRGEEMTFTPDCDTGTVLMLLAGNNPDCGEPWTLGDGHGLFLL